jgi:hypothetical protein
MWEANIDANEIDANEIGANEISANGISANESANESIRIARFCKCSGSAEPYPGHKPLGRLPLAIEIRLPYIGRRYIPDRRVVPARVVCAPQNVVGNHAPQAGHMLAQCSP